MHRDNKITYFARTNFRHHQQLFGIRRADRRFHMYTVGKTGTGKSTLLETLVRQDIDNCAGLALLDPHGDLVERLLLQIPERRKDDLIHFNVPDPECSLGFNPLESVPPLKRPLTADGLLQVFKKIWTDSWGPRLEHILRNVLLALLDQPEATLADISRLLTDDAFRRNAAKRVANSQVRRFWLQEYENYSPSFRNQAIAPIQNKVGAFLSEPILNRILTQPKSAFNLRQIMDDGKILLVNLAKGRIGGNASSLLGAMLVSQIGVAGLSRAEVAEPERRDFYLYLDEFQTFTTASLSSMFSELRKYRVNLILANQYLSQIDPGVSDAILGNVGTLITFRVGPKDAAFLSKELSPPFTPSDLTNLPNHSIYLKLMIDGVVSRPFSADTIRPIEWPLENQGKG